MKSWEGSIPTRRGGVWTALPKFNHIPKGPLESCLCGTAAVSPYSLPGEGGGRQKEKEWFPLQTNPWTPKELQPQWFWHLAFQGWMLHVSVSGDKEKWQ